MLPQGSQTYCVIVMGVLRMIKLFGWETKVKSQVYERRDAELAVVWRREMLEFVSLVVRCVAP